MVGGEMAITLKVLVHILHSMCGYYLNVGLCTQNRVKLCAMWNFVSYASLHA